MEQMTCPECHKRISVKLIPLSSKFEQTANLIEYSESDRLDAINFSITALFAGLVVFIFSWWYEIALAGVLVSATVLGTGIGLHILKMWLYRPKENQTSSIRVEHIDEGKRHWLIDELHIGLDDLQRIAKKLSNENWQWSMRLTTGCGLSQTKHHQLKREMLRLNYLKPLPNNRKGYEVTGRGRRVFMSLLGRT